MILYVVTYLTQNLVNTIFFPEPKVALIKDLVDYKYQHIFHDYIYFLVA